MRIKTVRVLRRLDRPGGSMALGSLPDGAAAPTAPGTVQLDLYRTADSLVILAELPGAEPDQVEITIQDRRLTLRGTRKLADAEPGDRFLCLERAWGAFERSLDLPAPVDSSAATARLEDGVLRVRLPVITDRRGGRQIPIQTRSAKAQPIEPGRSNRADQALPNDPTHESSP